MMDVEVCMRPAQKPVDRAVPERPVRDDRAPVLERALAEIARDVRVKPEAYLEQTRVPGGGE